MPRGGHSGCRQDTAPGNSVWPQTRPQPVGAPGSFFCTPKGQEGFDALSEVEEGVGAPPRPAEALLLWSSGGARSKGVSGGRAGETVTKCFASPRTLGEGGVWCGHLGGAQPHFLSLPPLATLLSVLALDFTAPDPELSPRDLSDGVYGLSSPKAGLLERGLWLTSHGFKTGPPNRSPDICCKEGKRERGRKGEGRVKRMDAWGWVGTYCWSRASDSMLPTQGAQVRSLVGELHLTCMLQLSSHTTTEKPACHK